MTVCDAAFGPAAADGDAGEATGGLRWCCVGCELRDPPTRREGGYGGWADDGTEE